MGAISYDDYKKKYGINIVRNSSLPKNHILKAKEINKKYEKNKLKEELEDRGIVTGNNLLSRPGATTVQNKINEEKRKVPHLSKYNSDESNLIKISSREQENNKKYANFMNTSEGRELKENVLQARDEESLARYNYNSYKAKDDYEKTNPILRTIQAPIRGVKDMLFDHSGLVRNEDGEEYSLPGYSKLYQSEVSENSKFIEKVLNDVLFQSGKIGASSAMNALVPYSGTTTYFASIANDQYNSAMQEGYSSDQALKYSLLSAGTEAITGKLLGSAVGLFGKSGTTESFISNGLKKVISNQKINSILSSMGSEGLEEFVQEYLDGFNRNLTLGEKNDVFSNETLKNAMYSGLVGALSSGVSQGANVISKGKVVNTANQIIYDIERANKAELSNINKKLVENIMYEKILDGEPNIDAKSVVDQFQTIKQNKINTMKESAYNYLVNNKETNDMLNTISKFIYDRNYNITFDPKITNEKGKPVNALINGDNIVINPNAKNAVEFLVMHEVTHSIETEKMKKLVLDYSKHNPEFRTALKNLQKTYDTNDVSSEVLADISGQLFGNQEFINNLSNSEPSMFRKIWDNLNVLSNKLNDTEYEDTFMHELKSRWGNAYRNTTADQAVSNLNNNIQYHISENINLDIDNVLTNINERNPVKLRDYTPKILVDNGVKDLPMYQNPSHIRKNILTTQEAQKLGLSIMPNDHYHGLGKDLYIKVIDSLDNPRVIFKNKNNTDYLILTTLKDGKGNNIIVPIEIETSTNVNNIKIDINRLKSVYGKENLNTYIKRNINQNEFQKIYEQKKEQGTGLIPAASSFHDNNVPQSNKNVKSDISSTKYSMQETENNTQELDSSSFSFKQKQLSVILKSNPMTDDYHTGIRTIDDIKTLEETLNDDEWADYDEFNPDLTKEDIEKAINSGKIIIYSSYPIEQGIFVSPSKMEAESYSGDGKVYSKVVNINDVAWIDPTQGQYAKIDEKYSQNSNKWQEYLDKNHKPTGTRTNLPSIKKKVQSNQTLTPLEISQLTPEDANTTPILPKVSRNKTSDGKSKFFDNINEKTNMLTEEQKEHILSDDEVKYYDKVTNKESLEEAYSRLNKKGSFETEKWFSKDSTTADSIDVAEGYILLKQYADNGNTEGMVEVAKKMRDIGTKAGQTVQAFNILERLTPEGMVKYAQSELTEAYNRMIKNQTQEWIDKHRLDFDLTGEEVQFILDNMKDVSTMEDGYDKRVKLAEIQKLMTDKLPPSKGAGLKSWMRISMLFNPKTQVRNVAGNAIIAPVNYFGDMFSSYADKLISKKTGVRTSGNVNVKAILKGIKEGAYEATNDFRKGINTKDMEGNRFEVGEGKSFNSKTAIGRSLNRVDSLLSYMLDAGDRVFSQSSFENSLQNQMILNNTTEATQEMIDIARTESLQRTWNDSNNYTKFVLNVRKGLNKINFKGYGLGDVLIPFAKTPANLTKAIVDYSPLGVVQTINDGVKLKRSLTNGQFTPQMQHKFVQDLGKATAGTLLYIAGYALAKAGITSGESDDDKDVANFMKNTLGISNYSIKIGDKTFTYDWAQPLAAPLSITANLVNKSKNDATGIEKIVSSLDTAGNILLEQSFLDSLNTVLSNNDGVVTGIEEAILELPSRAVPTFMKQVSDMIDGTQRTSFEKDKPLESAVNKIKVKLPGISKNLAPSVDTLGREIQKYGGENNIFNVFLNPANVNTKNISESAKEIYNVYKATGDKNVMPRVSDYKYKDANGNEHIMTSRQRASYQKESGKLIEDNVSILIKNSEYNNLSDVEKAEIIINIVNYSYNIARNKEFGTPISNTYAKAYQYSKIGKITDYYIFKNQKFESDVDENGNTITGSKKTKVVNYINSMKLSATEKAILIKLNNYSLSGYDEKIINYINSKELTKEEKTSLLDQLGYTIKDGRVYWK